MSNPSPPTTDMVLEKIMKWRQTCKVLSEAYSRSSRHYGNLKRITVTSSIILGSLASAFNLMVVNNSEHDKFAVSGIDVLAIASSIASALSTSLVMVNNQLKFGEKSQHAASYSSEFNRLYRDIGQELYLMTSGECVFRNTSEFLKNASARAIDLTCSAPCLPSRYSVTVTDTNDDDSLLEALRQSDHTRNAMQTPGYTAV